MCEVWKWLNKTCSLYHDHKVSYIEYQSWPRPLTLWPKINRVPLLIIHNLHVKIERDWTKTAVCIMPTRFYKQSTKGDLDFWPRDPKSIGFTFSLSTTYMWSLKVIGLNLLSVWCPQGKAWQTNSLTHPLSHPTTDEQPHLTISPPTLFQGDN